MASVGCFGIAKGAARQPNQLWKQRECAHDRHAIMLVRAVKSTSEIKGVTNLEFSQRMRELEKAGAKTYGFGSEVLMEGSAGFEVEELQRYLQDEGFYTSKYGITGYFGPVTKETVIRWQKHHNVLSTGNFGSFSRAKYLELEDGRLGKKKNKKSVLPKFGKEKTIESTQSIDTRTTAVPKTKSKMINLGSAAIFIVTLIVAWQALGFVFKRREELEIERLQMERDRAQQISRWMRTIDTDRSDPRGPPGSPRSAF